MVAGLQQPSWPAKKGKKEKLNFAKPLFPNPYGEEMEI